MTDTVENKPATTAAKPKAASKKSASVVIAVHRINGVIEPGTAIAVSATDRAELLELEAVREPTEAETALFEKNPKSVVSLSSSDDDALAAALD